MREDRHALARDVHVVIEVRPPPTSTRPQQRQADQSLVRMTKPCPAFGPRPIADGAISPARPRPRALGQWRLLLFPTRIGSGVDLPTPKSAQMPSPSLAEPRDAVVEGESARYTEVRRANGQDDEGSDIPDAYDLSVSAGAGMSPRAQRDCVPDPAGSRLTNLGALRLRMFQRSISSAG